ncbi:hypothetical protein [Streptomyces solicathayae]|uniref:Uncharacterized protein n=1 Tax=Streptomyces solicathayae TaxID=3081768 RepID=A0ABZ0LU55_9ACTN|nr:hypothetical protein [Streptomyces sp. HUAS YS2]WOX22850.1 hypothetical protein R2D22_16165 [Streptomyces sp. HUAS YS2]
MSVLRKTLPAVVLAATTVLGAGGGARAIAPEADVAHHGHVTLWKGRIGVLLESGNHGPSPLPGATVRLTFSAPPAPGQELPAACLWGGDRVVLCGTGPLRASGAVRELALELRTAGEPEELTVEVDTAWNGGASDRNPKNNEHEVLVLATGDPYVF